MAESTFKRSKAAEDAAVAAGTATREQIEARGGINASGYYGDSYQEGITLTEEEYAAALQGAETAGKTGVGLGAAINAATQAKLKSYYESQGYTPEEVAGLMGGNLKVNAAGNLVSSSNPASSGSSSSSTNSSFSAATAASGTSIDSAKMARQSAYDFLREQFSQYGLGSLVEEIKGLVESNVSPSEFAIRLRQTPTYKQRFAGNDARIKAGLRALSEGEYVALEDQYQNILRNYGLPKSYYEKDDIGRQAGFERFIAGDVSPAELEDRIQLGLNRVKNAAPEVEQTLRQFYPGISQGDILAYTLDPDRALTDIQRKVQAAEIGAEAVRAGLTQSVGYAEELQRYGVTKETAQQGFQTIAGLLPRASQLGDIYAKQGMGPYTQTTAEQEVFGLPSAAEAATKRRKLSELEQAAFGGRAGTTGGALGRERAGQF